MKSPNDEEVVSASMASILASKNLTSVRILSNAMLQRQQNDTRNGFPYTGTAGTGTNTKQIITTGRFWKATVGFVQCEQLKD